MEAYCKDEKANQAHFQINEGYAYRAELYRICNDLNTLNKQKLRDITYRNLFESYAVYHSLECGYEKNILKRKNRVKDSRKLRVCQVTLGKRRVLSLLLRYPSIKFITDFLGVHAVCSFSNY